jgi:hypothetical protein
MIGVGLSVGDGVISPFQPLRRRDLRYRCSGFDFWIRDSRKFAANKYGCKTSFRPDAGPGVLEPSGGSAEKHGMTIDKDIA